MVWQGRLDRSHEIDFRVVNGFFFEDQEGVHRVVRGRGISATSFSSSGANTPW